jgi:hypothetical protein
VGVSEDVPIVEFQPSETFEELDKLIDVILGEQPSPARSRSPSSGPQGPRGSRGPRRQLTHGGPIYHAWVMKSRAAAAAAAASEASLPLAVAAAAAPEGSSGVRPPPLVKQTRMLDLLVDSPRKKPKPNP